MERPRLALHPERKRKFFSELAVLLKEEQPEIRPIQDAFPAAAGAGHAEQSGVSNASKHRTNGSGSVSIRDQSVASVSVSLTGDEGDSSFVSVEFGAPRTMSGGGSWLGPSSQNSGNESTLDSLLFLPDGTSSGSSSVGLSQDHRRRRRNVHFQFELDGDGAGSEDPSLATTLVNSEVIMGKAQTRVRLELADYYDCDRMCELTPCWLRSDGSSCDLHQGVIGRPMLLFCLQALDEFIEWQELQGQQRWRVQACKLARRVFTAMWEADVLSHAPFAPDIALHDCLARKTTVVGVALDVWRIIARYWDKYKQNYLHQQELYFTDAAEGSVAQKASKWGRARELLHIYGMKPSQALRLVEHDAGPIEARRLTDKQLEVVSQGLSSIDQLLVGMEYLGCQSTADSGQQEPTPSVQRPTISQQDGKTAFSAILIHLKKWSEAVQVFPCSSFSRGAAYISVLDILVAVPIPNGSDDVFQQVAATLATAKVLPEGVMRPLSSHRGVCIVPFKDGSILLDLKVYRPPKSWFALLYFTGPETFVATFFSNLLKRSLRELSDVSFDAIYDAVADILGAEALLSVESEKDLFDLAGRDYLLPADRI
ncbi:hypothetical protein BBJ28_00001816 [Nothophytophthora sp. Chile5]|nr:hypothetical protein BBJ28_00001816 [Nothophytophthora sp. Chile5]